MSASHVSRSSQPITTKGMGRHFSSPRKARNKKKTLATVSVPVHAFKRQKLLDKLASLLAPPPSESGLHVHSDATSPIHHPMEPPELIEPEEITVDSEEASPADVTVEYTSIVHPTKKSISLCESWHAVIRTMIEPFIKYTTAMLGKPLPLLHSPLSSCTAQCREQKVTNLLCLFFDRFLSISITSCDCSTLPQTLISHGLFPTAPSQPQMAVSVELLSFYRALFERSCDAINALAAALSTYYGRQGFRMTNQKGTTVKDPFRRGLSQAAQWYAILQVEVEKQVDSILQCCRCLIKPPAVVSHSHHPPSSSPPPAAEQEPLSHTCADILIQQCPACFGGVLFGTSLDKGGDIHVAMDGNFHHCHRRSAGDSPSFYEPSYFLPKAQRTKSIVPDEAIDQCEASYEAMDGQKQKASTDGFDDTGLMALICRHDIPLFFANIDTPGEQQKYSVTLIDHLFSLLPPQANVVVLYDVGCVLARSLCRFDIFDQVIMSRLRFATTAMHVYGHEWACQLVYNPRLITGLGLSDGEGTERLWSCFIKLIGIERVSSHQRCIWLLDQHAAAIGYGLRTDLGDWARRRLKKGVCEQGSAAQEVLDNGGVSIMELQEQWANQRAAQLSIRAHAPMKLKKELDTVLSLQAELDTTTKVIQVAQATIERGNVSPGILDALASMERSHARLITKAEALYSSLNIHEQFPELMNVSLDFVRTLLMARDLKINIRKRAIGSFFEWDKLDRAVGGKDKPLGTKLHQQTCKAIAKCQPALMAAIRKYNAYLVVDDHTNSAEDEDMWGVTDLLGPDLPDLSLEPEQIALSDVLGVGRLDDQDDLELEAETLSQVSFKWEIPSELNIDCTIDLAQDVNLPAIMTPIIWTPAGFPRQTFFLNDISILMSPTTRLNDTCINGCATLLYSAFRPTAASCTILSTHDLPRIHFNAEDNVLWRNLSWTL
ncbi:hypothetical protein EDC04DRAFT_2916960 [Pisolithus marmoratus]|nr:hypothetical protein EDC04DRAFT_2916960 [Pisolithus marmoratus]